MYFLAVMCISSEHLYKISVIVCSEDKVGDSSWFKRIKRLRERPMQLTTKITNRKAMMTHFLLMCGWWLHIHLWWGLLRCFEGRVSSTVVFIFSWIHGWKFRNLWFKLGLHKLILLWSVCYFEDGYLPLLSLRFLLDPCSVISSSVVLMVVSGTYFRLLPNLSY